MQTEVQSSYKRLKILDSSLRLNDQKKGISEFLRAHQNFHILKRKEVKMMKRIGIFLVAVGLTLSVAGMAMAQTATQTVQFRIDPVNSISVSANPPVLTINTIPGTVVDSTTSYGVSTNQANRRITGQIDNAMPEYTELRVALQPVTGSSSTGSQVLSTTPVSLVTTITRLAESGRSITYTFNALSGAAEIPVTTRTVTFTITTP